MTKKYIVHPDWVGSKIGASRQYIDCNTLIRLYGINPSECICDRGYNLKGLDLDKYVHLYPDYHGIYKIPKEKNND